MLSVGLLDLGKIYSDVALRDRWQAAVELCQLAEAVGFDRYWIAEHHVADAAFVAPEVVLPLLAAATSRIAVGPAGVLLSYYSPLKVAEVYTTMAAAFDGRIEVGVCRGPGVADRAMAKQLVWNNAAELRDDVFSIKAGELASLFGYTTKPQDAETREKRGPFPLEAAPPLMYILGSSKRSADEAIANSLPYALMCFYPGSFLSAPALLDGLRAASSPEMLRRTAIALSVVCEETTERARQRDDELVAAGRLASNIVGDPAVCAAEIRAHADRCGVSRVMLASFDRRQTALRYLTERLGAELVPATSAAGRSG